jgi:hypothetical protein
MSGQRKDQKKWVSQLEDLYKLGDDEKFLEIAEFVGWHWRELGELVAADCSRDLHRRSRVELCLRVEDFEELARRLEDWGETEDDPERLAQLWSLELCARRQQDLEEEEDEDQEDPNLRGTNQAISRLRWMAFELKTRFPSDRRLQVARFLRDLLVEYGKAVALDLRFLVSLAPDDSQARRLLDQVDGELDRCRPLMGEDPEFVATEVAFDCWRSSPTVGQRRIRQYLERFSDLESTLVLFARLEVATQVSHRGIERAMISCRSYSAIRLSSACSAANPLINLEP